MALVTLTVVHDEAEAELLCGLLRANGIECGYRKTDVAAGAWTSGFATGGPLEVLIDEGDLAVARELVPVAKGSQSSRYRRSRSPALA